MTHYIGNGPYCYSNSTAMLLESIGEHIEPRLVEVLSGVGLGAFIIKDQSLLFLSGWASAPDIGISSSLRLLGFRFSEESETEKAVLPAQSLAQITKNGPVIIGPLDMGELDYQPNSRMRLGADHYVIALSVEKDYIVVHDPAGYPFARLGFNALKRAWSAERISYRRDYYRRWHSPNRTDNPSEDQLLELSLKFFLNCYKNSQANKNTDVEIGYESIRLAASRIERNEFPEEGLSQLKHFALALGARRALDYEWYFRNSVPVLAELKKNQAFVLGSAHSSSVHENRIQLANDLKLLSDVEHEFEHRLFRELS